MPRLDLFAIVRTMKGNECASSEESIDTNDNFKHSANAPTVESRRAKSTRRYVRTAKRAQERERSSLQISYRSGVREARVLKTSRPYILRPFCLRIHSFSSISRTASLALAHPLSRIYRSFPLLFFSFFYALGASLTPYGSRVRSPRVPANSQLSYGCRVEAAISIRSRCSSRRHPQVATFQGRALRNAHSRARNPRVVHEYAQHPLAHAPAAGAALAVIH